MASHKPYINYFSRVNADDAVCCHMLTRYFLFSIHNALAAFLIYAAHREFHVPVISPLRGMNGAVVNNNFSLLSVQRFTSAPDEAFNDLCLLVQTNLQRGIK